VVIGCGGMCDRLTATVRLSTYKRCGISEMWSENCSLVIDSVNSLLVYVLYGYGADGRFFLSET